MIKNLLILIVSSLLILIIYSNYQKTISINDNLGYDGIYYYEISEQIKDGHEIKSNAPFIYRIGTPFIASIFNDIKKSYLYINIIFSFINTVLIFILISNYLNIKQSLFLSILYNLHWIIGIRYTLFDPIGVDQIALSFLYCGIIILTKSFSLERKIYYILFISIFGVFFREIALIPSLVLLFISFKDNKKSILPILTGSLVYLTIILTFTKTNDYNGIVAAIKWFYIKGLGANLLALFNVYGLLIILLFIDISKSIEILKTYKELSITLIVILTLSLIGGSDTERILSWSLPFFYIIIFKLLLSKNLIKNIYVILIFSSLILTYRFFNTIPFDVSNTNHTIPILSYISNDFNFADLFSYHGNKIYTSIQLVEYLVLSLILVYFLKRNLNGNQRNS